MPLNDPALSTLSIFDDNSEKNETAASPKKCVRFSTCVHMSVSAEINKEKNTTYVLWCVFYFFKQHCRCTKLINT